MGGKRPCPARPQRASSSRRRPTAQPPTFNPPPSPGHPAAHCVQHAALGHAAAAGQLGRRRQQLWRSGGPAGADCDGAGGGACACAPPLHLLGLRGQGRRQQQRRRWRGHTAQRRGQRAAQRGAAAATGLHVPQAGCAPACCPAASARATDDPIACARYLVAPCGSCICFRITHACAHVLRHALLHAHGCTPCQCRLSGEMMTPEYQASWCRFVASMQRNASGPRAPRSWRRSLGLEL